ncbi:MAG: putative DNA-binding transcriptional regulator AlpA [Sediminicola sp.]|jgi:predicted DNA-binding transcriptional regulator AlpA
MSHNIQARALSEIETAEYIGMSRSFLRQSRMEGNRENRTPAPPFIKIGRAVRYIKDDLDNWLNSFYRMEHLGQKPVRDSHA